MNRGEKSRPMLIIFDPKNTHFDPKIVQKWKILLNLLSLELYCDHKLYRLSKEIMCFIFCCPSPFRIANHLLFLQKIGCLRDGHRYRVCEQNFTKKWTFQHKKMIIRQKGGEEWPILMIDDTKSPLIIKHIFPFIPRTASPPLNPGKLEDVMDCMDWPLIVIVIN